MPVELYLSPKLLADTGRTLAPGAGPDAGSAGVEGLFSLFLEGFDPVSAEPVAGEPAPAIDTAVELTGGGNLLPVDSGKMLPDEGGIPVPVSVEADAVAAVPPGQSAAAELEMLLHPINAPRETPTDQNAEQGHPANRRPLSVPHVVTPVAQPQWQPQVSRPAPDTAAPAPEPVRPVQVPRLQPVRLVVEGEQRTWTLPPAQVLAPVTQVPAPPLTGEPRMQVQTPVMPQQAPASSQHGGQLPAPVASAALTTVPVDQTPVSQTGTAPGQPARAETVETPVNQSGIVQSQIVQPRIAPAQITPAQITLAQITPGQLVETAAAVTSALPEPHRGFVAAAPSAVAAAVAVDAEAEAEIVRPQGSSNPAQPAAAMQQAAATGTPAPVTPASVQIADAAQPAPTAAPAERAPASANPAPRHDFGQVVERLAEAREMARPGRADMQVNHREFGQVTMQFDVSGSALKVALSNAHAGFAPAVQAALADGARADLPAARQEGAPQHAGHQQQASAGSHGEGQAQRQSDQPRAQHPAASRTPAGEPQPEGTEGRPGKRKSDLFA